MPSQNDKQRLSVIADEPISITVDATDLSLASAEPLRNIISRFGRPVTARAFADFQQTNLSELAIQLYQMGFTLVHCPSWPNGDGVPKPIVSDVMAQDLRDQLEELDGVETFIVAATSRDFIAVANALRRHDRRVIVVGEEAKVCRELRMCGDEFITLPPARAERSRAITEAHRAERALEPRPERPERYGRGSRGERAPRLEPLAEAQVEPQLPVAEPREERPFEPRPESTGRPERAEGVTPRAVRQPAVAPRMIERPAAEAPKIDRQAAEAPKIEKAEPQQQDAGKMPTDAEVIAEVRRIATAEGICTPRRLGRALCPVDKSPTGEMRSRIANRIQSLVDSGSLIREKLVVGGTSVETILVRDGNETVHEGGLSQGEATASTGEPQSLAITVREAAAGQQEAVASEPNGTDVKPAPATPYRRSDGRRRKAAPVPQDLDSLVESVLRSPELAADLRQRESAAPPELRERPQAETAAPDGDGETTAPTAPKRSRSRRKSPAKAGAAETAESPDGAQPGE